MSAACIRLVLNQAGRAVCGVRPCYWTPLSRFLKCSERSGINAASWSWSPFSIKAGGTKPTPAPKEKKHDPKAHATLGNMGRRLPRQVQVLSETGEDLGAMTRAEVIRIMDHQGLKLVQLGQHKDLPLCQLMSGKQLHEEQLKLRDKQKTKPALVQVKELTFSPSIASHDLSTKLKQVEGWLGKKHHVRITVQAGRGDPTQNLDRTLEQMVQQIEVMFGFVSKPKSIRDGKAAMCVLRLPSAKELAQRKKDKIAASQPASSSLKNGQGDTAPVSSTDTTEGSIQQ